MDIYKENNSPVHIAMKKQKYIVGLQDIIDLYKIGMMANYKNTPKEKNMILLPLI